MSRLHRFSRGSGRARRGPSLLASGALAVVVGLGTGTGAAIATAAAAGASGATTVFSDPTAGHPYRHGAVPLRGTSGGRSSTNNPRQPPSTTRGRPPVAGSTLRNPVSFGGGSVVTRSPRVYLVFWGSQWGSPGLTPGGYQRYSGDPRGLAPNLQALFDGLGTNNELWSTIFTQYCQGVPFATKTCPVSPSTSRVVYPATTVLGGVWEDTSAGLTAATGAQIAQEAANAAVHFSNPPGAQYVIVSPTRTDPDQWLSPRNGYCAYHDNTGDPSLGSVSGPDVPYTNMPYVPDVGDQCSSFVNPGALDGADETISHEYGEVLTDPFPSSGWTDRQGGEIADKCENVTGGQPGGSRYVALATGTFALQGMWANDFGKRGGCENAHSPILAVNPPKQKVVGGVPVSLQVSAADVLGRTLSYAATGLPHGLVLNATTGVISGIPTTRGRTSTIVTVSDPSASATVAISWLVKR